MTSNEKQDNAGAHTDPRSQLVSELTDRVFSVIASIQ